MPDALYTYTIAVCTAVAAGNAMIQTTHGEKVQFANTAVWVDPDFYGTDAEWDAIDKAALPSQKMREIAKYLLETGQAMT